MDYTVLKTEIDSDPKGLGYSGKTDQWITDKLNEIGASSETKTKSSISTADVLKALVWTELNALNEKEIALLNLFTYGDNINPSNANIQNIFKGLFGVSTTTRANLIALSSEPATRGEIVFSAGTTINSWDVARAKAL